MTVQVRGRCAGGPRLVGLVKTMAKLVAVAFGMDPQAALIYLADSIDPIRGVVLPSDRR
ncbi:hypothetical protein [Streptomyces adustus]|uniref:hypothetical protein n=1 Tax=Streptomyces adustus TaxID=1609272 RepID=UPI003719E7B6